jgi:hypothetical protein
MATYIQGITDYIPKIQPFQPDFNFFQKALDAKQNQYEAGYNKISSVYGQLLNSDLLRESNVERRNQFFTEIDNEIKRLSGVDLSLPENVQQATSLFQPLINNDYFRYDIAYTKAYRAQKRRSEALRLNPDSKSGVKWWADGDRALDYQAEDFSKSSDDESLRFANPRYVPFVNGQELLFKFAKDNDINPEAVTKEGGYIVKTTNGPAAIPTLQSIFSSLVTTNPQLKDVFATQAYLQRKDYMRANAEKFGGDELAAETDYLKTSINSINEFYRKLSQQDTSTQDKVNTTKKVIENKITRDGIDPDLDADLVNMYRNTLRDEQVANTNVEKNKEVLSQTDDLNFDEMDIETARFRVDNAMSYFMMDELVGESAKQYAYGKMKIDTKVDDYALAATNHKYRLIEQAVKHANDKELAIMRIAEEIYKNGGFMTPGTGNLASGDYYEGGILRKFTPIGGVSGDTDINQRNESVLAGVLNESSSRVIQNVQSYLDIQNFRLQNPNLSQDERNLIEQDIANTIGLYTEEDVKEYTTEEQIKPLKMLYGLGAAVAGVGGAGIATLPINESNVDQMLIDAAVKGAQISSSIINATDFFNFIPDKTDDEIKQAVISQLPKEQVTTETTVKKHKSGIVVKDANGKYVISQEATKNLTNPDHVDYYSKLNERVAAGLESGYNAIDKNNQSLIEIRKVIDYNNAEISKNNQVIQKMQEIQKANSEKLLPYLAKEAGSGVTDWDASIYTKKGGGIKSKQEYIADWVAAYKDNYEAFPKPGLQSIHTSVWYGALFGPLFAGAGSGPSSPYLDEKGRLEAMTEEAEDKYDDLTEAYESLSKNADIRVNLEAFSDQLVGETGINRFFTNYIEAGFDPAIWNTASFNNGLDVYFKDMRPAIESDAFRNQLGAKFVFGSALNITRDDYAEMENDPYAAQILDFFLSSAFTTKGGKANENTDRPKGKYMLQAVAANDGNKLAMTCELDPEFVNKHKGSKEAPGPTWALAQQMSEGKIPSIAFFIDADKAQSNTFTAMQQTKEEFLYSKGGLTIDGGKFGGSITFTPNSLGGASYNGFVQAVDQSGKLVNSPIFGNTNENINALSTFYTNLFGQASQMNQSYLQSLSNNSTNKLTNPNDLVQ